MATRKKEAAFIAFLLCTAISAYASPTINQRNNTAIIDFFTAAASWPVIDFYEEPEAVVNPDGIMPNMSREFQISSARFWPTPKLVQGNIKPLPAGPGAVLMAICGFACVSLVRDRRWWLSVLVGLLCLGRGALCAAAQSSVHVRGGQSVGKAAGLRDLADTFRLTTRQPYTLSRLNRMSPGKRALCAYKNTNTPQHFILPQKYTPIEARSLKQEALFVCFAPGLISESPSRGPPLSTI